MVTSAFRKENRLNTSHPPRQDFVWVLFFVFVLFCVEVSREGRRPLLFCYSVAHISASELRVVVQMSGFPRNAGWPGLAHGLHSCVGSGAAAFLPLPTVLADGTGLCL